MGNKPEKQDKPETFSLTDWMILAGIVLFSTGVAGFNKFAGLIALGSFCLLIGYGLTRK